MTPEKYFNLPIDQYFANSLYVNDIDSAFRESSPAKTSSATNTLASYTVPLKVDSAYSGPFTTSDNSPFSSSGGVVASSNSGQQQSSIYSSVNRSNSVGRSVSGVRNSGMNNSVGNSGMLHSASLVNSSNIGNRSDGLLNSTSNSLMNMADSLNSMMASCSTNGQANSTAMNRSSSLSRANSMSNGGGVGARVVDNGSIYSSVNKKHSGIVIVADQNKIFN